MTGRLYCWYQRHPWVGRQLMLTLMIQLGALLATVAAPPAFASSNAAALNWTGVKDAEGVPIGNYYLAAINLSKQAKDAAPEVTVNPVTWFDWLDKVTTGLIDAAVASFFLTLEAGLFTALLAISVWLFRLAAKSVWLTFFGALARPFVDAMFIVVNKAGLLLWLLPIAVFAGAFVIIVRGAAGRGWMMILSAFMVATVGVLLLSDPVALMYGDDGLLATGRSAAFQVAEAAVHNGAITGAHAARDNNGQLEIFTSDLISAVARGPFQLWQYGHTLTGRCDQTWTQIMLTHPSEDAPIKAMQTCGDVEAARYAANLNGNNAWLGLLLCASAFLFTAFLLMAGGALVMVPARAMYRVIKAPVDIYIGIPEGPGRAWMLHALKLFAFMLLEMFVYTLFVCIAGMAMSRVVTHPLPADLGGNNPVAKMLMFAASSCVTIGLFRTMRAELFGVAQRQGALSRLGWTAAGAAASVVGGRGVTEALKRIQDRRAHRNSPPWEDLQSKIGEVAQAVGASSHGFDSISADKSGGADAQPGGHTVKSGGQPSGEDSPPAGSASGAPRPVPKPTSLSRPQTRQDKSTPADRRKGGRQAPVVAGQHRKPVPAATSGGAGPRGAGLDTINADRGRGPTAPGGAGKLTPQRAPGERGMDTMNPNQHERGV